MLFAGWLFVEQAFPLFFHLIQEWLLLCCLPFFLLHRSFLAPSVNHGIFYQKRYFFKTLSALKWLLWFILFLTLFLVITFYQYRTASDLLFFEAGSLFFRQDFIVLWINLFLTVVLLFFCYLIELVAANWKGAFIYELPVLLLTVLISLRLLIAANDLILILLTLEIIAFSSIILISGQFGAQELTALPVEAAIKYFVINAVGVAFMLFALSGYYALTNSLNLLTIVNYWLLFPATNYLIIEGVVLAHLVFFFAFLVKLGAAPFHQWVPDVYEGAETVITAFLVLVVSPGMLFKFILLLKVLGVNTVTVSTLQPLLLICGLGGLLFGSLGAFFQYRIKRFVAYTGITHLGFILLSLATALPNSFASAVFYLLLYMFMNMVFFTLLLYGYRLNARTAVIFMTHFRALCDKSLLFTFLLICTIFSFAGLPPFAGFFSKLVVLALLVNSFHPAIVGFTLFYILVSAYLYLRFIKIALFEQSSLMQPLYVQVRSVNFYHLYRLPPLAASVTKLAEERLLVFNWFLVLFFLFFVFWIPFLYLWFYQCFFYFELFY
jgi:NADH-quinone oxidoreductase subunit N